MSSTPTITRAAFREKQVGSELFEMALTPFSVVVDFSGH